MNALVASVLNALRPIAPDVFPGGWAWTVTLLGVVVGLLPAAGAFLIALVRKIVGARRNAGATLVFSGIAVLTAGLVPLLVFTAAGRLFQDPQGLGRAVARELRADNGLPVTQAEYLGGRTVASAFSGSNAFWLGYAVLFLAVAPLVVTVLVWIEARLALRRGPRSPVLLFWLSTLALAGLTWGVPAGTAGQMWVGAGVSALVGIIAVALVGKPREVQPRRSVGLAATPGPTPLGPSAVRSAERDHRPPIAPTPAPVRRPPPTPAREYSPTLVAPQKPPAGRPPPPRPQPMAGPRFTLIKRLGSGGFGRVWLAQDAKLGHVVALKAAHAPDTETEERIRREANALAAVRHPNSVRIYDMVPARSDPGLKDLDGMVIVMGYVEGESLGELVRARGLLDDVRAARIWVDLAGGLDAAHWRGVMHRDVKPANIVVDKAGRAHLIDFGIARKTGDATMTQAGFVLGTPDFLAPEIACGQKATAESDSWQLAATISYALTGHPPRGEHPDAVSGLRAAAGGAPLSHLPRRTAHLALLRAALDNDPTRRPPLREVQKALQDWLRRQGSSSSGAVPAGAPPR